MLLKSLKEVFSTMKMSYQDQIKKESMPFHRGQSK